MRLLKSKKGVLENLGGLAISVVVFTMIVAISALILSNLGSNATITADGNASAAVTTAQTEVGNLPDWLGIIVIVAVGGLLIFLVRRFSN